MSEPTSRRRLRQGSSDREPRKRLWLEPVFADLKTPSARESAKRHQISLRLAGSIAGLIVNLDSFLDSGCVYPTAARLGELIKNSNGTATSGRQVRRAIAFLTDRDHLRVVPRPGQTNLLYPRYRKSAGRPRTSCPGSCPGTPDIMSGHPGHHVHLIL